MAPIKGSRSGIPYNDSVIPQDIVAELEQEYDLLPNFQRITVSGEDTSGVSELVRSLGAAIKVFLGFFVVVFGLS